MSGSGYEADAYILYEAETMEKKVEIPGQEDRLRGLTRDVWR
ncbi:hypothetical protein MASR2M17_15320 [Aminivibrio sp.]